ncbi:Ciliogenesis and planar polarity effector 2 [Apodemus speciosus]|uniref:Ciliogenesis and planar polarity effector 2 n=1 Tax=Apodemus speciosus TaxID=105296 RepID=A0ABQ0EQ29_APOSI
MRFADSVLTWRKRAQLGWQDRNEGRAFKIIVTLLAGTVKIFSLAYPTMARPPMHGSVIVPDWHETVEGKEFLACILRKNRRREFGLLERPVLPPSVVIDTASYKIFVSGKSGVGKTALVAKLAGLEVPTVHHETTGIQTTVVFWPAKLKASDRVVMFRFEFWDCGESALKKFDHILPACKENADAFLFLFSFTDRASFEDLPGQLARVAVFDQYMHTDVPERDLTAFRQAWELPLFRVKSVPGRRLADGRTLDGRAGLADTAHVLNGLAEQLWHQDQVAAGLLPSSPEDAPG